MTFRLKPPQEWQNQELWTVHLNLQPHVSHPRSVQSPVRLFWGITWASSCLNQTIRQCCFFFSEPRNTTAHQLWTSSGVWCGAEQLDMVCTEERRQICYSLCSVDKYLAIQVKEGHAKYQNFGEVILKKYTSFHPEAKVLRYYLQLFKAIASWVCIFLYFFWRLLSMTSFILASIVYLLRPLTIQWIATR